MIHWFVNYLHTIVLMHQAPACHYCILSSGKGMILTAKGHNMMASKSVQSHLGLGLHSCTHVLYIPKYIN